jgi:hypothetical protein
MAPTGLGNPVTAVLMAQRALDTLLESAVLVFAVFAIWSMAPERRWGRAPGPAFVAEPHGPLAFLARVLPPIGIVIGIYIAWVGADAPGGNRSIGQQRVEIHLPRARWPFNPDGTQRPAPPYPLSRCQSVQNAGQRGQGLKAGAHHLAAHENADLADRADGKEDFRSAKLPRRAGFHIGAEIRKAAPSSRDGRQFGQQQHAIPPDPDRERLPRPSAQRHHHLIPWT